MPHFFLFFFIFFFYGQLKIYSYIPTFYYGCGWPLKPATWFCIAICKEILQWSWNYLLFIYFLFDQPFIGFIFLPLYGRPVLFSCGLCCLALRFKLIVLIVNLANLQFKKKKKLLRSSPVIIKRNKMRWWSKIHWSDGLLLYNGRVKDIIRFLKSLSLVSTLRRLKLEWVDRF
jgi:hypothetical protein